MNLYILKSNMIKYICYCPPNITIPTNDFKAYNYYKKFRHLYNKKFIADSQELINGTNKNIPPNNMRVIVRPIKNLEGMGKGAYFLNDNSKIKEISNNDFWVEVLEGEHISVDIFYNHFGFLGVIAFRGYPGKEFTFTHWEYLPNYSLPKNILKWVNKHLSGFIGVLNLELINDKIIECHLRMGDLNYFQSSELMDIVIKCYQNKPLFLPKLDKIYLIPVFVKKGKYIQLKKEDIWMCARKSETIDYILNYFIDPLPENCSNPNGGDRICNFTVSDYNKGVIMRKEILEYVNSIEHNKSDKLKNNWFDIFRFF